eukprot:3873352-Rhodomonas_salina.1
MRFLGASVCERDTRAERCTASAEDLWGAADLFLGPWPRRMRGLWLRSSRRPHAASAARWPRPGSDRRRQARVSVAGVRRMVGAAYRKASRAEHAPAFDPLVGRRVVHVRAVEVLAPIPAPDHEYPPAKPTTKKKKKKKKKEKKTTHPSRLSRQTKTPNSKTLNTHTLQPAKISVRLPLIRHGGQASAGPRQARAGHPLVRAIVLQPLHRRRIARS